VSAAFDPQIHDSYRLFSDYPPRSVEHRLRPTHRPEQIAEALPTGRIEKSPISASCIDGFTVAYWRRPRPTSIQR
jgi:hypothetical protein